MKAYRYLDDDWGPRFWTLGLIGISTTESVGAIEGPQRDGADASLELTFDHHFRGAVADEPEQNAALQRMGFDLGSNSFDTQFSGIRHITRHNGLMICMSSNPDSTAFPGKGWVVEISDVDGFARSLIQSAHGRLPRRWAARPVTYEPRTFDARDGADVYADPFIKAAGLGYEEEEEVRLFWPTQDARSRFNILSVPSLRFARLVRRP